MSADDFDPVLVLEMHAAAAEALRAGLWCQAHWRDHSRSAGLLVCDPRMLLRTSDMTYAQWAWVSVDPRAVLRERDLEIVKKTEALRRWEVIPPWATDSPPWKHAEATAQQRDHLRQLRDARNQLARDWGRYRKRQGLR